MREAKLGEENKADLEENEVFCIESIRPVAAPGSNIGGAGGGTHKRRGQT